MKTFITLFTLFLLTITSFCQSSNKGQLIVTKFVAPSIRGNKAGEDSLRRVSVYLPPGYNQTKEHYPVIYFLHGLGIDDSLMIVYSNIIELLDTAIQTCHIHPVIVVMPNSNTNFDGSFYTNSSYTGNWSDYISKDVVAYIDKDFRTIANRNSRGIAGHSMGGNGALKIAMLYPNIFGCVYALSPAVLNWGDDFNLNSSSFKIAQNAKTKEDLDKDFYSAVFIDLSRTYSPDINKPPFYGDLPVTYTKDSMIVDSEVVKQWEANFPINMIETHLRALKSLTALKLDWGRNDEFSHIPSSCLQFSKKLEAYGVKHFAEEYFGTHTNKLADANGRIYTEMLPFFDAYLKQNK